MSRWRFILLSGDVAVHIFLPEQREIYILEEFYANVTLMELPLITYKDLDVEKMAVRTRHT